MISVKLLDRKKRALTIKLAVAAISLLILSQGFNGLLITFSLEKLYIESLISSYQILGRDLERNIEKALRYGKRIEKFYGMDALLESTLSHISRQPVAKHKNFNASKIEHEKFHKYVAIALPEGKILYSTHPSNVGSRLPENIHLDFQNTFNDGADSPYFIKNERTYIVAIPIHDHQDSWVATAVISFDEDQIKTFLNAVIHQSIRAGVISLTVGIITLILALHLLLSGQGKNGQFPRKKISWVVFAVVCFCQVSFSAFSTNTFNNYYIGINREKADTLNTLLKEDIEYFLTKGLKINKLKKLEVNLGEILAASPEIKDICVLDGSNQPLYFANADGITNFTKRDFTNKTQNYKQVLRTDDPYHLFLEIEKESNVEGYISARISRQVILKKLREIIFDSVTVVVISILFTVELLIMVFLLLEKQIKEVSGDRLKVHFGVIRPAAFLLLFGIDASISFLPLHMEQLYVPILGLSKNVVMGLPISMEMLFAGISIIFAGAWIDRRTWHEPLIAGLMLAGLGNLYSWQAMSAVHFILSRGLVGLGYGLFWMASQGFILSNATEKNKVRGLALLFAGIYAGNICGSSAGALLAERIGYTQIFFLGSIVVFLSAAYSLVIIQRTVKKPESTSAVFLKSSTGLKPVFGYLMNRNVLGLIILSSIPSSLAVIGFLHYFSPIYLNHIGATQSSIGRIFMIYGICLILIAPVISRFIDTALSKKKFIVAGGIAGSLGLIVFQVFGGYTAAVATILLLGLSGSCDPARSAYALKLKETHEIGVGKAMGILSLGGRLGQVAGPITFGWLILFVGTQKAITYFGFGYLIATIFFLLLTKSD